MIDVNYPDVHVPLVGEDGNAFFIVGRVSSALKQNGVSVEEVQEFQNEATSGNYDHLLNTVTRWVSVS